MLPTRNANIILVYVLFLGIFAGWRPSHPLAQEAATAQDEKEGTSTCQVVRLSPQQLLSLVTKRIPLAPPAMLHNSRLHGQVTVEVSLDQRGNVTAVKGVRGHPFAISSAVESIRVWSFKSYKRDGEAQCVAGLITLNYDFRSPMETHK